MSSLIYWDSRYLSNPLVISQRGFASHVLQVAGGDLQLGGVQDLGVAELDVNLYPPCQQ